MTQDSFNPLPPGTPFQMEIDRFVIAAGNGEKADVLAFLSRYGEHIDRLDSCGDTALTWAIHRHEGKMAELLLDKGADPNARDRHDRTPLLHAIEQENKDVARLLLDRGADVNARDSARWTPLMRAAELGRIEIVRLFLERGADPEAADRDGWTAATLAETSHPETAQAIRKWVKERDQRIADKQAAARAKKTEAALKKQRPQKPSIRKGPRP